MARGLWSTSGPPARTTSYSMPDDPSAFLSKYKGQQLEALIEGVPNGSTVRARLLLSPDEHQYVNVGFAGVRAPRASNPSGGNSDGAEEYGDEARFFAESRLLQRQIKITLLSLPTPSAAPVAFGSNAPAAPAATASMFLGTIHHPAGNIAALLLSAGLAKIVDWHAGFRKCLPSRRSATRLTFSLRQSRNRPLLA